MDIISEQIKIHSEICKRADKLTNGKVGPITDGIYVTKEGAEFYSNSHSKIMWILKEPWEDGEKVGDWDLLRCMNEPDNIKKVSGNRTWNFMAKTMYGIVTGTYYDDMPSTNEEIIKSLKEIVYINISKLPGKMRSNDSEIRKAYSDWKDIIFEQIDTYSPDVIIFGGTFKYFKVDIGILKEVDRTIDETTKIETPLYKNEKGLYLIDTYHPAYLYKDVRINSIIDLVRNNIK